MAQGLLFDLFEQPRRWMDAGGQCSEIKEEVALPAAGGHSLHWPPVFTACARPCLLASLAQLLTGQDTKGGPCGLWPSPALLRSPRAFGLPLRCRCHAFGAPSR